MQKESAREIINPNLLLQPWKRVCYLIVAYIQYCKGVYLFGRVAAHQDEYKVIRTERLSQT